jgi:integrase
MSPDKFLQPNEIIALRAILERCPTRDKLYFTFLLETGARLSEALSLTAKDFDHSTKSVCIRGLKGSRDRIIALKPSLFLAIVQLGDKPFNFSASLADKLWRVYRPVKKKLHSLRHTFAIDILKKTNDIHLVNYALGHKNIQNTMVYLSINRAKALSEVLRGN